jgi:hypothetical protein
MAYGYRTVFLDKLDEEELLAMAHNPLSVAVVAAMRLRKAGKNEAKRFEYGREMLRLLKSRGYPWDVRHQVVLFITGLVNLSVGELLEEFEKEMDNVLEEMESMSIKVPLMEKVLKKKSYELGILEGQKKTARAMLADSMTPDLISKFTGLSVEEVEALRTE